MNAERLDELMSAIPKYPLVFAPTPFHKLENLSKKYGVNIYMKREDMSGPSNFGGQKIRKLELIIGEAIVQKAEYIVTVGCYQSNSSMELIAAAIKAGIKPIVYLSDIKNIGLPKEYTGNLLLSKLMGAEVNYVLRRDDDPDYQMTLSNRTDELARKRTEELRAQGYRAMYVPGGCVHQSSLPAHISTFKEITLQAQEQGFTLDYLYHTTGTGGTLPGLIAGKLLMESPTKIVSCSINPYKPGSFCCEEVLCERVKTVYKRLGLEAPNDAIIYDAINVDQNYIGEEYAIPSTEATAAIQELAQTEAIFVDPVYTGKGLAGMLDHIRKGLISKGSSVAFLHTGGTGALFSEKEITGQLV